MPPSDIHKKRAELLKKNAAKLAAKYTTTKRIFEIISITFFVIFYSLAVYKIATSLGLGDTVTILVAQFAAMMFADFAGGLVHWGCDTWGSLNSPFVGNSFIRSFREHHVDPYAITRHDWIETNGDTCMLTVPIMAYIATQTGLPFIPEENCTLYKFFATFLVFTAFWVAMTNQIHKWSHQVESVTPSWVAVLQNSGIIMSRPHHNVHHTDPFDAYYCITNGWMNSFLMQVGFWRKAEAVVSAITGMKPREDDFAWTLQFLADDETKTK